MFRDTFHSVRQSVSVRRVSQAFVVMAVCILLALSLAPVSPVAAQETNETAPCDFGPPVPGDGDVASDELEVALAFDNSQSMGTGSRLSDLKNATTGFVDRLEDPEEVGLVTFGSDSNTVSGLTRDYQLVSDEIEAVSLSGSTGTQFADGIADSRTVLTNGSNATDGATKVIIFATDGQPEGNEAEAIAAAEAAREDGITIFSVGVGGDTDEQFLTDVAGSEGRVFLAPDSADLNELYEEIQGDIDDIQAGGLRIDTRSLFQPGETHGYEVTNVTYSTDPVTNETTETREDVTDEASVTTSNSSVLSVDESTNQMVATDDAGTSTWVRVDATTGNETGCVNVIVAEASMENLELLPPVWRFGTFLGDWTVFFFIISIGAGIVGTRIATSFMGLSMMELVLIMGWFGGYISTGLVLTSVFACLFIGLNLAANIDYQVTR